MKNFYLLPLSLFLLNQGVAEEMCAPTMVSQIQYELVAVEEEQPAFEMMLISARNDQEELYDFNDDAIALEAEENDFEEDELDIPALPSRRTVQAEEQEYTEAPRQQRASQPRQSPSVQKKQAAAKAPVRATQQRKTPVAQKNQAPTQSAPQKRRGIQQEKAALEKNEQSTSPKGRAIPQRQAPAEKKPVARPAQKAQRASVDEALPSQRPVQKRAPISTKGESMDKREEPKAKAPSRQVKENKAAAQTDSTPSLDKKASASVQGKKAAERTSAQAPKKSQERAKAATAQKERVRKQAQEQRARVKAKAQEVTKSEQRAKRVETDRVSKSEPGKRALRKTSRSAPTRQQREVAEPEAISNEELNDPLSLNSLISPIINDGYYEWINSEGLVWQAYIEEII
jgi:hypothetical protein